MHKLALTLVLLTAAAGPALGAGSIGVYADAGGSNCEISDPGGGALQLIYIVETNDLVPVGGSAWKLEWDAGMTMTWIGETTPYFHVGSAKDGISMTYSPCQGGTFLIDTVSMTSAGTSTPCSHFRLVDHPTQGLIIARCSSYDPMPLIPGDGIVNADATCHCNLSATEPTTWGRVKALYR
ncbi:MAG TPA: hypothetical protein VJS69_04880 [Candidatus Krumholzibacteria bacterium]|nr:hypothetical protein [Candidatus Krumholzibacteria bacterium]